MKILFLLDVSPQIGMGHLYRCLYLCEEFSQHENVHIDFAGKGLTSNPLLNKYRIYALDNIEHDALKQGIFRNLTYFDYFTYLYRCIFQAVDEYFTYYDIIIVDNYAIGEQYLLNLKTLGGTILVIDDLFNRRLFAHVLIHQMPFITGKEYQDKLNRDCHILSGFDYVILPNAIHKYGVNTYTKDIVENIVINAGGSDSDNITNLIATTIINALKKDKCEKNLQHLSKVHIILGKLYPDVYFKKLVKSIENMEEFFYSENNKNRVSFTVYKDITFDEMMTIYKECDLCIGGLGVSTLERAYIGMSQVIITANENQVNMATALKNFSIINYLGDYSQIDADNIIKSIKIYPVHINNGPLLIDGLGTKRIAYMLGINKKNIFL